MLEVRRSLLVAYPVEHLFDVIEQAEHYPKFVPWCTGATIRERSDDIVEAQIHVDYHRLRFSFVTRNPKQRPQWLDVRLTEGPFRRFEGGWRFTPLAADACRVEFTLRCELSDWFGGRLATAVFERVTNTLVDAFIRRAEMTYHAAEPAVTAPAATAPALDGADVAGPEPEQSELPDQAVAAAAPVVPEPPIQRPPGAAMTQADPAIVDALRASKLAAELDADQTAALAAMMTLRDLAPNEVLVREGETDNHLYVIVSGTLAAMKHAGTVDQVLLASLHPGEFAGELAFIDGAERYASLVALGPTRVLGLERERFESLVDTNPRLLYRVMRSIVRAVHELQRRLSMQSIELSNYVYKQHGRY